MYSNCWFNILSGVFFPIDVVSYCAVSHAFYTQSLSNYMQYLDLTYLKQAIVNRQHEEREL